MREGTSKEGPAVASTKLVAGDAVVLVVSFVALAVFARELGAAGLGVYALFLAALNLLSVPADLGLATATEKRVSEGDDPDGVFATATLVRFVLFVAVAAALVAGRGVVEGFVGPGLVPLLVVGVLLQSARALVSAGLRGVFRVGETATLSVLARLTWVVVGAAGVALGLGPLALIYGTLAGDAVAVVVGAARLRGSLGLGRPSRQSGASLVAFAKYNLVPTVGYKLHNWLDVVVVGLYMTQAHVGAYQIAWQVAGVTTVVSRSIGTSLLPVVSAAWARGDADAVERLLAAAFVPALAVVVAAVAGAVAVGPALLGSLFGPEYAVAFGALVVLLVGKVFAALRGVCGRALLGVDRPRTTAVATAVQAVANLALNFALVPVFGLVGAAVATAGSAALGTTIVVAALSRHVPLRVPRDQVAWLGLSAAGMAAAVTGVRVLVPPASLSSLAGVLVLVLFGAATYAGLLALHPDLRALLVRYYRLLRSHVADGRRPAGDRA